MPVTNSSISADLRAFVRAAAEFPVKKRIFVPDGAYPSGVRLRISMYRSFLHNCLRWAVSTVFLCAFVPGCREQRAPQRPASAANYHLRDTAALREALDALASDSLDLTRNISVWVYYTEKGDLQRVIGHAAPAFGRACDAGDTALMLYAGIYLAQSYLFLGRADSLDYYLSRTERMVPARRGDGFLQCMIHNTRAIRALKMEMNYPEALDHFKAVLDILRRRDDPVNVSVMLCNIASIYLLRGDTAGMRYVREAYGMNDRLDNAYTTVYSTTLMARMSLLGSDTAAARRYAGEARAAARRNGMISNVAELSSVLGETALARGDAERAWACYREALSLLDRAESGVDARICRGAGDCLFVKERFAEAVAMYRRGLELSEKNGNVEEKEALLLGLFRSYRRMGLRDEALEACRRYYIFSDSLANLRREQEFSRLLMRYERSNHENAMQAKELELMHARRNTTVTLFVLAVIAVALAGLWVVYRRSSVMYRRLVEKHQLFLARMSHPAAPESGTEQGAEDRKSDELYARLEELMRGRQVYRCKDISLDMIARMLDTNRVYVSRAINRRTGMTFYNYINMLRIEQAVRQLSDPEDDEPLKSLADRLGYNSLSAFYRAFSKETGCPPSRYRTEVRRLRRRPHPQTEEC